MKVFQIIEYRNFGEQYSRGIYSSEENAKIYLKIKGWDKLENFEIIECELDEKLKNK